MVIIGNLLIANICLWIMYISIETLDINRLGLFVGLTCSCEGLDEWNEMNV